MNRTLSPPNQHPESPEKVPTKSVKSPDVSALVDPVSIEDWIESARGLASNSKNDYVESAVDLALAITERLSDIIRDPTTEVKAHDVYAKNVLISLDRHLNSGDEHLPSIKDIKLSNVRAKSSDSLAGKGALHGGDGVCAQLGRILLEIFSMGRYRLFDAPMAHCCSSEGSSSLSSIDSEERIQPVPKKRAVVATECKSITTSAAKDILLGLQMPLSISRLVCDLLKAGDERHPSSALTSLDEALWDLTQMKEHPQLFLFDQTCAKEALEHYQRAAKNLFGRETHSGALAEAKRKVVDFLRNDSEAATTDNFLCEAVFLSGHAGSGKSSLIQPLVHSCERSDCEEDQWFVLHCKFTKHAAPIQVLAGAFDQVLGRLKEPANGASSELRLSMIKKFNQVCQHIFATIDDDAFRQLQSLMPNFARMFPFMFTKTNNQEQGAGVSPNDKVGGALQRLKNLLNILLSALCAESPVLFALEDLHWSDESVMECLANFVVCHGSMHGSAAVSGNSCHRQGLLIIGAYQSNAVKPSLIESIDSMKASEEANVKILDVGELSKDDVTRLVSAKLCLPWRYTRGLAEIVHMKTRGNPFHIVHFLDSIVQNKMLEFSRTSGGWVWDDVTVEMQIISDGVAELLMSKFKQLPSQLMKALKIVACLGSQVEVSTVEALDSTNDVLSFSILDQMRLGVEEGILEAAGPLYQYTHDIIHKTIYDLIPEPARRQLHKIIAKNLMKHAAIRDPSLHLLAINQLNIFCKGVDHLSPEERLLCACLNAGAAKFAMVASTIEDSRPYIDMGIKLLLDGSWETEYSLCLALYEMSATVSFMHGDTGTALSSLRQILSHCKTFYDSLNASLLVVKLLAASSKFEEAMGNCLRILEQLGEEFPYELGLPLVMDELSRIQPLMQNVTIDQVKSLPPMNDSQKLNSMKFMNVLCGLAVRSKPLLSPLVSSRMVRLTFEHGLCEDSIVGLVTVGYGFFTFTENRQLGYQIGKMSEMLIEESPVRNSLRSRVCHEWNANAKITMEPAHTVVESYLALYNSAILVGDIESAIIVRYSHCSASACIGQNLSTVLGHLESCMREAAFLPGSQRQYQQESILYSSMALHHFCMHLSGSKNDAAGIKSYSELSEIGQTSSNRLLLFQCVFWQLAQCFWIRDYAKVVDLSEKSTPPPNRRALDFLSVFYEGIACLRLCRGKGEERWRAKGEEIVKEYATWASATKSNFENKLRLLQAELHCVDGDLESAESSYKESIASAREHKWKNEEALAYELYGLFCVENGMNRNGVDQLQRALEIYKQWGAMRKVNDLQQYIDGLGMLKGTRL